jgi:prepilin-type N-terminal cleavage/methylation domain-containing protein
VTTRRDAGYTLTEVLVAVVIMSVAITALLGSIASEVFTARVHRDIVTSDAVARFYAEQLLNDQYDRNCTGPGAPLTYQLTGLPSQYAGYSASIVQIQYADASANSPVFSSTCAANAAHEMERITIKAGRGPTYVGQQQIQIIKRNPA